MPVDHKYDDEDDKDLQEKRDSLREFDCPSCNANNPSEGFNDGDEILCNYCGTEFKVTVTDEGRVKFREI